MASSFSTATLSVNLAALRANYQLLKSRHAKNNVAAVVKANAYGLGVKAVSEALLAEGCNLFFVATLAEAIELRGYLPDADIAVFNGIFAFEEPEFAQHHIIPVLNSPEQVMRMHDNGWRLPCFLHIDSGMTRLGLSQTDLLTAHEKIPESCRLILSHLASASEADNPQNTAQLARLHEALKLLPGIPVSFANSSGHFLPPDFHFDIGRPGCALYGINPTEGANPMQHVATLSAPILQIRALDRDEQVGYSATASARKDTRLAVAGLGYSDGYFRSQGNKGTVMVAGHKAPIVGRISMDMITVDVSHIPEAALTPTTRVEFINEFLPVDVIAQQCDTIGYEVFTRIGRRVERVYSE